MDDETRAAFGRIDRYFELGYAETRSLRADVRELKADVQELKADVQELKADVNELRTEVNANSDELRSFRDWAVTQFAELRAELRRFNARLERVEQR